MQAKGLMATALVLAATAVQAQGEVGLHVATWHERAGYESVTPGLYLRTESGLTLGLLRNSIKRTGAYAGWTWGDWTAVSIGGITGYAETVRPFIIPSVRVGAVRLMWLPKADPKGTNGVSVAWRAAW